MLFGKESFCIFVVIDVIVPTIVYFCSVVDIVEDANSIVQVGLALAVAVDAFVATFSYKVGGLAITMVIAMIAVME